MIQWAKYTYADSRQYVTAMVDGMEWQAIDLNEASYLQRQVQQWLDDGNTPEPSDNGAPAPQGR